MAMTTGESALADLETAPETQHAATEPQAALPRPRVFEGEQRVVLRGIGWEGYETILGVIGNQSGLRVAYDHGDLELMSPSFDHEEFRSLLGRFVETVTEELRIPCRAAGSTTWRRIAKERGLEADECFYLASASRIAGKRSIDLSVDPVPDLAIEVEISRSSIDQLGIYGSLGVGEVWRFNGIELTIHVLGQGGTYERADVSRSFPFLPASEIVGWLERAEHCDDHSDWGRQLRHWVRDELQPRRLS